MASNPLIGTWRLISWENRSVVDGQISYPLGRDATGYIMYNEDGYMFVAIMGPNRLRFAADDLLSATTKRRRRKPRKPTSPIAGGMSFTGTR
jgi:hypothetical protein